MASTRRAPKAAKPKLSTSRSHAKPSANSELDYQAKREKNNVAVRKSREKQRLRFKECNDDIKRLEKELASNKRILEEIEAALNRCAEKNKNKTRMSLAEVKELFGPVYPDIYRESLLLQQLEAEETD